jgi:hypothetical protein
MALAYAGTFPLEFSMKQKPKMPERVERPEHPARPLASPQPTHGPAQKRSPLETPPAEPAEVLGRHKNTGQKDHKGAR